MTINESTSNPVQTAIGNSYEFLSFSWSASVTANGTFTWFFGPNTVPLSLYEENLTIEAFENGKWVLIALNPAQINWQTYSVTLPMIDLSSITVFALCVSLPTTTTTTTTTPTTTTPLNTQVIQITLHIVTIGVLFAIMISAVVIYIRKHGRLSRRFLLYLFFFDLIEKFI